MPHMPDVRQPAASHAAPRTKQQALKKAASNVLLFPLWAWTWFFNRHRPDVVNFKTREEHWQALRSQWRWAHAVFAYLGPPSHVMWNIKWPLCANIVVGALTLADAMARRDVVLNTGTNSAATLAWRLSSFMLSLLMAFKVNRVYDRWWTGRQAYAGVGNAANTLTQQVVTWVKDEQLQDEIIRWCKVWHFAVYGLLMRQNTLHPIAAGLLSQEEAQYYQKARKGRNLVTIRLRQLISHAGLGPSQILLMDQTITKGVADQGACTRLMFQCMPYGLTLMCSGFLEIWLLLMPFSLFTNITDPATERNGRNAVFELVLYVLICILMLGVDEVASQLEQPFPHMPLLEMAESTFRDVGRTKEEAAVMERLGNNYMKGSSSTTGSTAAGLLALANKDVDVAALAVDVEPHTVLPMDR